MITKTELFQIRDGVLAEWIKVKRFDDTNLTTEDLVEKFRHHHKEETTFLIGKCKELAAMVLMSDSAEKFTKEKKIDMSEEIYYKITTGGFLTDEELKTALSFFRDLRDKLEILDPIFRLAANEINHYIITLEGFDAARKK